MEGPAFSTEAESNMHRSWGAKVIGMTNMTEARLAREAEISLATISMATDYDCWRKGHESVTVEQIRKRQRPTWRTPKDRSRCDHTGCRPQRGETSRSRGIIRWWFNNDSKREDSSRSIACLGAYNREIYPSNGPFHLLSCVRRKNRLPAHELRNAFSTSTTMLLSLFDRIMLLLYYYYFFFFFCFTNNNSSARSVVRIL